MCLCVCLIPLSRSLVSISLHLSFSLLPFLTLASLLPPPSLQRAGSRLEAATSKKLTDPTKYTPKQYQFAHDVGSKPRSTKGTLSCGKRPDPFEVNKSLKEDIEDREDFNHTAKLDQLAWNKPQASRCGLPFGSKEDRFKQRATPPSPCVGSYHVDGPERFLSTFKTPTTPGAVSKPAFGATTPRPVLSTQRTTPSPNPGTYAVP